MAFSRFGTVPAYDRQTDRETDGQADRRMDTWRLYIPRKHSVAR